MTRKQAGIAAGTFALLAIAATIGRLAYELFLLGRTDDKLGTPVEQFETVAGVHLLAIGLAAVAFAVGLMLARFRSVEPRTVFLLSAVAGLATGLVSVVAIANWVEVVVPLRGWADEMVSVLLTGLLLGVLVRTVGALHRTRLAV